MNGYYNYQDQAHRKWIEAQELISRAEVLFDRKRIDETEWYRMLADARMLQEDAINLEKQAADAQVIYWREKYVESLRNEYSESELQARDWAEQHYSERP